MALYSPSVAVADSLLFTVARARVSLPVTLNPATRCGVSRARPDETHSPYLLGEQRVSSDASLCLHRRLLDFASSISANSAWAW
jgi:hypothetical protein